MAPKYSVAPKIATAKPVMGVSVCLLVNHTIRSPVVLAIPWKRMATGKLEAYLYSLDEKPRRNKQER